VWGERRERSAARLLEGIFSTGNEALILLAV
jgi:hypothetical protein